MEIFRDWEDIKAALHRRRMTFTRLATMYGLDPSACRVAKSRTHRKAEAAIADFLGVPVEKLFPDRYPIRTARILSSKYDTPAASPKSPAAPDRRAAA